jgi:hypothetical protein
MADISLNNLDGIPFGNNSGRPANPTLGQPYFNGEASRLEIYTSNGWQNIVQETPAVVNVVGSARESTSSTITINGTNFAAGANVFLVGTNGVEFAANSASLVSVVEITANIPALSPSLEPYDVKVVNPSNLYGVLYETLNVDASPAWTTGSGSLGTYIEQSAMSVQVSATDASDPTSSALIYSISSGALPPGLSISSSTGVISGTPANVSSQTTYNFTANAYDGQNNSTRNFSITITDRAPTWVTAASLPTFTRNVAYSTTLSATNDDAAAISYSLFSGSLPTGLALNSSTGVISGTPTSSLAVSFTIRATDSTSNTFSDRQFTITNAGPVWTTSGALTGARVNNAYSFQLVATDDSGNAPVYTLASGSLPAGLSLSSSGLISGTPTTQGSSSFVVTATDANSNAVNSSMSIYTATLITNTFTSSTNFTPAVSATVSYSIVGGGGGGGRIVDGSGSCGGGGGGGGVTNGTFSATANTTYQVIVGGGGGQDSPGSSSSIFGVTSGGGINGLLGRNESPSRNGGASGNGNGGGSGSRGGGGGGGAGGGGASTGNVTGGNGGSGAVATLNSTTYAGGGAGGSYSYEGGGQSYGGSGGGGNGGNSTDGSNGSAYGAGGGGGGYIAFNPRSPSGGSGFQGVVLISYFG